MKNLLVGNGINIQFDNENYTTKSIVSRVLKNCDREDFPSHIIVDFPYLLKNYIGKLFLEARNALQDKYDDFVNCEAEKNSLKSFKEQYKQKLASLTIMDIGFEDYYLIHDLVCHKTHTVNPEQYTIREAMRIAYLFSIYNDGKLNTLHTNYSDSLINYLKGFDCIFTTNYDSNIDSVIDVEVYHIHGWFEQLEAVYDAGSYRNHLPDAPIKNIQVDDEYFYLYSNALSTHCGAYKEFQLKQYALANDAVAKLANAYITNPTVKKEVDLWMDCDNNITANIGYAVKAKVDNPDLTFKDNYHFDKLTAIVGELEILGLSPWNDFHIFEAMDNSNIEKCIYYYFSEEQCKKVESLLPNLFRKGLLEFLPVNKFWSEMNEK